MIIGKLLGEALGHFLFAAPAAFDVADFFFDFAQAHFIAGAEHDDYAGHYHARKAAAADGGQQPPHHDGQHDAPGNNAGDLAELQLAPDGVLPAAQAAFIAENLGHGRGPALKRRSYAG